MKNNSQEQNVFSFNYSAKEQAEIKRIRDKYTPSAAKEEDKMLKLLRLDQSVTNSAQTFSLIFGVIGTLILGSGMSLVMTDVGRTLGMTHHTSMIVGIVTGIIGGITASLAYPVYNAIVKIKRKKIAPEIIRLTDELMK